MMRLISVFLLCWCVLGAQKLDASTWDKVKQQYDAKNYSQARSTLEATPENSAAYFFNLGTIHYRLGEYGRSFAFLEKAHSLSPSDEDIAHNRDLAQAMLFEKGNVSDLDPGATFVEGVLEYIPSSILRLFLGLFSIFLAIHWFRNYRRNGRILRPVLFSPISLSLVGTSAVLLSLLIYQLWFSAVMSAIVLDRQMVRSGPGKRFLELRMVEAGTKVRTLGRIESESSSDAEPPPKWFQVRYAKGAVGWLPESSLLLLDLPEDKGLFRRPLLN